MSGENGMLGEEEKEHIIPWANFNTSIYRSSLLANLLATSTKSKGYEVLGVSCDSVKRHQKFIEKYNLAFSLISDEDKKVVQDYGVWDLKKFMGREYMGIVRTTFIINERGIIEGIINKVDTKNHTNQIL